jgi:hypothetical protein
MALSGVLQGPTVKVQAARSGFNQRGVVTVPSHAYIRLSLGHLIATEGKDLKALAFFGRFR